MPELDHLGFVEDLAFEPDLFRHRLGSAGHLGRCQNIRRLVREIAGEIHRFADRLAAGDAGLEVRRLSLPRRRRRVCRHGLSFLSLVLYLSSSNWLVIKPLTAFWAISAASPSNRGSRRKALYVSLPQITRGGARERHDSRQLVFVLFADADEQEPRRFDRPWRINGEAPSRPIRP